MSPFRKNKKFQATKRLFNEDAVPHKCRYYYISFDLMIHISAYFFFIKKQQQPDENDITIIYAGKVSSIYMNTEICN
jgi:hypothetical protein